MTRSRRRVSKATRACLAALLIFVGVSSYTLTQAQTQTQTFTCYGGFGEEPLLLMPRLQSLRTVENPMIEIDPATGRKILRDDLADYVINLDAAIRLGKALFWDMQAGSDNKTACATCHYQAGSDTRRKNTVHPGPNADWDRTDFYPNSDLLATSFPFVVPGAPDVDNIVGSQGVRRSTFGGIGKGGGEIISPVSDPVFGNLRQVGKRNAPTTINAVFSHRLFHDGRAQPTFNGVNPLGSRDSSARVYVVGVNGPALMDVRINNASIMSQSVGPVLDTAEMSAVGRTFPDVGKKLMAAKPLALQQVSPADSVLGMYADTTTGKGLNTTYKAMVQAAFHPKWWNYSRTIKVGTRTLTVMEANMSLFWGIAVGLYQSTLVSDDTPMDRYLAARLLGDPNAPLLLDDIAARITSTYGAEMGITITRDDILNGLRLFELPPPPSPAPNGAGCILCHVGPEMTSASATNLIHGVEADDVFFANLGFDQRLERMFWRIPALTPYADTLTLNPLAWTIEERSTYSSMVPPADVPLAVYDTGYYNIGVRPTPDDHGTMNADPAGNPWSIVKYLQKTMLDTSSVKVPGGAVACGGQIIRNSAGYPVLAGSLRKNERALVDGSFKTPHLRNVELNGPYFHNGGKATLMQVMEMYDDGGDFKNPELAPLMRPLGLSLDDLHDLTALLLAFTDDRVKYERAPFDHPELILPAGESSPGVDSTRTLPAVGAGGLSNPLKPFMALNPFQINP